MSTNPTADDMSPAVDNVALENMQRNATKRQEKKRDESNTHRFDEISRVLFPAAYTIFFIIYTVIDWQT